MAFIFKLDTEAAETVGQSGGMRTGVYPVTVKWVSFSEDKKGNPRATFCFENETGKRAFVFDMMIAEKWATGSKNFDYPKWQEFASVVGMKTGEMKEATVEMSKDKKEKRTVFVETIGKKVNVAFQEVFDVYENKEKIDKVIYRTFTIDGKTLQEVKLNAPAKTMEAVATSIAPYYTDAHKSAKANGTLIVDNGTSAGTSSAAASVSQDDDEDIL